MVTKCGVDFCRAIDYASANPAKNLGLSDSLGSIAEGKNASFAVLDIDFKVLLTVRDGVVIYQA